MKPAGAIRRPTLVADEPRRAAAPTREQSTPRPTSTVIPAYLRNPVANTAVRAVPHLPVVQTKPKDARPADAHAPAHPPRHGPAAAAPGAAAKRSTATATRTAVYDGHAKSKETQGQLKRGQRLERLDSPQAVAPNPIILPEVETGGASLAVQTARAPATDHGFEAPPEPRSRARAAPGGKSSGDPHEFGRSLDAFREALNVARQLHDRLVADARDTVARVESTQDRLAGRRQSELDQVLSDLGADLRQARGEFNRAADATASLVDQREAQTHAAIQRAAGSAFGALNGAKAQADADFAGHVGAKDAAKDDADIKASSVGSAGDKAGAAVGGLDASKEKDHPTNVEPMPSAINEAINVHLPLRAPPRAKTYADEAGAEVASLTATFKAMKEAIEEQFKDITGQMKSTADSCSASIGSARTGALKQLAESAQQLRASIEETRANGHSALVNQHNQSRRQLIGAFRERARSEDQAAQQRATRGAAAALSLATGQQAGARSLADNLAREQGRPEQDFARIVASSARAMLLHIGKAGPDQRMRVLRSADAGEAGAEAQALATAARLTASALQMCDRLAESSRNSGDSLKSQIAHSVEPFDQMPEPIRQALKGALRSAVSTYASQNTQAGERVTQARETVTGAMSGNGGGKAPEGAPPAAPAATDSQAAKAKEIPDQFVTRATEIAGKPETDEGIAPLLSTAKTEVRRIITDKEGKIAQALEAFSTKVEDVIGPLRNITQLQGAAISDVYAHEHGGNLEARMRIELFKTFSADSTNDYNIDAAVNYLHGNHVAAALSEMKAAVNYSNDEGRVERIQRSLTPAELDQLRREHPDELKDVLEDLDGTDRQVSFALNRIKPVDPRARDAAAQEQRNLEALGEANAYGLQHDIDTSRKKRGEEGGDATADAIAGKRATLGNDVLSGGDALSGSFEDPEEARTRRDKLWAATDKSFDQVVKTLPDGTPNVAAPGEKNPPGAIARYAAAARSYEEFVPDNSEAGGHYRTVSEGLDPRQTQLIDAIVKHGADSEEAAAATLAVELNRKSGKPKEDRLRKALGSDLLAAREGESDTDRDKRLKDHVGPDGKVVKGDLAKSKDRRENILLKYAELTRGDGAAEPGKDPEARTKAAAEVKNSVVNKLGDQLAGDPTAKAYTQSMVQNLEPDPVTAFDFALAHEEKNKETLLATTGRMNRDQIDDAVKKWDAKYPLGPPLYKRLGMFEHGSGALEGDARNETEIAFMGVPRNDRERAEVANMATKQQVRDSGAGGRALASDEYQRMLNNQAKLLGLMGVKAEDIDQYGRIRKTGADGQPIHAHFDESGHLIVKTEGQRDEFEAAMQMSSLDAESYKQAVDRAAAGVVMALMVIAAAVTTFVTFGGAAAIWGPILITAGAGLVGIAMTAAIRGDRYTRAEIERDLVMTFVQAATAGLGAYAGTAMRGAGVAAKAAASSEKLVGGIAGIAEKEGLSVGAKALGMGKEVLIEAAVGGTTNAINSAAGAAMDPENRRQGKSGEKAFDSGIRGFLGGAVGSALTKPIGGLAKGFGKGGERVLGNVASGFGTRLTEARVGEAQGEPHQSWAESLEAAKEGIGQDVIRSLAEHGAEHYAEHRDLRMRQAAIVGGGRGAPAATSHAEEASRPLVEQKPPPETLPSAPRPSAETAGPQHSPESIARAQAVREALPPELRSTIESAVPAATGGIDPIAAAVPRAAPEQPAAPAPAAEPAPVTPAPKPGSGRSGEEPPGQQAAQDPHLAERATHPQQQSKPDWMLQQENLPPGSVVIDPDQKNPRKAVDDYKLRIGKQPHLEAAIYRNAETGTFIVVQGDAASAFVDIQKGGKVSAPAEGGVKQGWKAVLLGHDVGHWELVQHFHPVEGGGDTAGMGRRLPSSKEGDFGVLRYESKASGDKPRKSRINYLENGQLAHTDFGYDPRSKSGKYWVEVTAPGAGKSARHEFATIGAYEAFFEKKTGRPYGAPEPAPAAPTPRMPGAESGPQLHGDDHYVMYHGTTVEGKQAIEEAGVTAARTPGKGDDFSAGFYVTSSKEVGQEYASKRSGTPGGGEVMEFRISKQDMGVVVDIRPGGEHRADYEKFMAGPSPYAALGPEYLAKTKLPATLGEYVVTTGHDKRGEIFEQFLKSIGKGDADAIHGDLGGLGTKGIGANIEGADQIAIRSQKLADKLTAQMRGADLAPVVPLAATARPSPLLPEAERQQASAQARSAARATDLEGVQDFRDNASKREVANLDRLMKLDPQNVAAAIHAEFEGSDEAVARIHKNLQKSGLTAAQAEASIRRWQPAGEDAALARFEAKLVGDGMPPVRAAKERQVLKSLLVEGGLREAVLAARERKAWSEVIDKPFDPKKQLAPRHKALALESRRLFAAARIDPELAKERFAGMLEKSPRAKPTVARFQEQWDDYIKHHILPVISESDATFRLGKDRRMGILKSESTNSKRKSRLVNQGGIDIVGFVGPKPGEAVTAKVDVYLIDDKAETGKRLNKVSAQTENLGQNLRDHADEFKRNLDIDRLAGKEIDPAHEKAVQQLQDAANKIEDLDKGRIGRNGARARYRQDRYIDTVAAILKEYNIHMEVTSERGNIKTLAKWLERYGFRIAFDDEDAENKASLTMPTS